MDILSLESLNGLKAFEISGEISGEMYCSFPSQFLIFLWFLLTKKDFQNKNMEHNDKLIWHMEQNCLYGI